jgi:glyoxylase-like metal-dependent hydrolase (beta-lactamase superfamily II)
MSARVDVLVEGYVGDRVGSSVTLLRDGDTMAIVDPGMVASRQAILGPLAVLGVDPEDVTDVLISHHHPDHTINIALFPRARVHDFASTYVDDLWLDHDEGDFVLSASITFSPTPGHTAEDASTLVRTESGLVVLTHLWWRSDGPADDPYAPDRELLREQRERVLAMGPSLIVPGHGAPFVPGEDTPR